MFRFLKTFFIILKNLQNLISLNSDLSTDCKFGTHNKIKSSRIYNSTLNNNCTINEVSIFSSVIGNHVSIHHQSILFSSNVADHVSIGSRTSLSNTTINRYCYLAGNNRIFNTTIGAFCSIAENVCIGHAEHPYNQFSTSPLFYKKDNLMQETRFVQQEIEEFNTTTIGNDVWIGYNAYIKSGLTIGDGCVIGAGAIVTKNLEPYSIAIGVPARIIKKRFDNDKILKLQSDKWWDLNDEELFQYSKLMYLQNPKTK